MATETSESFLVSLGMLLFEDVINYSVQLTSNFLTKYFTRRKSTFQKSIIRNISCRMTWIKARRFHIVWREGLCERSSECDEDELSKSLCLCPETANDEENPPTTQWERKIEELEKEMFDLRSEVSKLLLLQENRTPHIGTGKSMNPIRSSPTESVVSSSSNIVLPSIPPPPPPPLPPMTFLPTNTPLKKVKVRTVLNTPARDSTGSIVEELSKRPPKLRHVERSPGGRPIRTPAKKDEAADKLAAILRKRFEAIHSPPEESCLIPPRRIVTSPKSPELFGY